MFTPRALHSAALLLALVAGGCGSSNRLREVDLDGSRIAILAAVPPSPRVQGGDPGESAINPYDPVGSAIRVGTAVEKYRQADRAQGRLDSVAATVDVADRIARRVLAGSADALGYEPVGRPADADFLLDLRVYDYALVADSYEGETFFALEADVLLVDPHGGRTLWKRRVRERETLDAAVFGVPVAVGNVVTARALGRLSEEEMAAGLERLADYTADRIVERLRRDYYRSRR